MVSSTDMVLSVWVSVSQIRTVLSSPTVTYSVPLAGLTERPKSRCSKCPCTTGPSLMSKPSMSFISKTSLDHDPIRILWLAKSQLTDCTVLETPPRDARSKHAPTSSSADQSWILPSVDPVQRPPGFSKPPVAGPAPSPDPSSIRPITCRAVMAPEWAFTARMQLRPSQTYRWPLAAPLTTTSPNALAQRMAWADAFLPKRPRWRR
mmetsp:Transcript_60714/g.166732  ORF Transcript_60714/g.166732 Transcript_60714/m.166732 type:complete len:206 (-) Transcript_60714:1352-1969(-)